MCVHPKILYGSRKDICSLEECLMCDPVGELYKKAGWCSRRGEKKCNYVCLCAYTYISCVCTCTLVCLSRSQPLQNWCLRGLLHEIGSISCPEAELNLLSIFQTNSNCRKHGFLLLFACALLYEDMNFKFSSALENDLGWFQGHPEPRGPAG